MCGQILKHISNKHYLLAIKIFNKFYKGNALSVFCQKVKAKDNQKKIMAEALTMKKL